ncbi:MAG TPA: hypothetical protein VJP76_00295 [Candidatus Tumulicola sp.]|nr:hypothetical protein [Candidatus Tumulicola sp.]
MSVRDRIAQFIESEGHCVEIAPVGDTPELAEIVFRTRGQTYSVAVSEAEPDRFSISTAYEVPETVRDHVHTREIFADLANDYPETRFSLAQDDSIFIATTEYEAMDVEAFVDAFWQIVGQLREAGTGAIERMVDRSESKAAADKFISQFMKGERQ